MLGDASDPIPLSPLPIIARFYDLWAVEKELSTNSSWNRKDQYVTHQPCVWLIHYNVPLVISFSSVPAFKIRVISVSQRLERRCNKLTLDIFFCPSRLFL